MRCALFTKTLIDVREIVGETDRTLARLHELLCQSSCLMCIYTYIVLAHISHHLFSVVSFSSGSATINRYREHDIVDLNVDELDSIKLCTDASAMIL